MIGFGDGAAIDLGLGIWVGLIEIHNHAASILHRRNQRFDKRTVINLALFLPNHCREHFASILPKSDLATNGA